MGTLKTSNIEIVKQVQPILSPFDLEGVSYKGYSINLNGSTNVQTLQEPIRDLFNSGSVAGYNHSYSLKFYAYKIILTTTSDAGAQDLRVYITKQGSSTYAWSAYSATGNFIFDFNPPLLLEKAFTVDISPSYPAAGAIIVVVYGWIE